jgi:hypothetical protein
MRDKPEVRNAAFAITSDPTVRLLEAVIEVRRAFRGTMKLN